MHETITQKMYSYDSRQDIPSSPPNHLLPFIPAPDYSKTIKQPHPSANQRPSLLRSSPNSSINGSNLTIFTDFNQHDHIVDLTNGKMIPSEDLSKPPKQAFQQQHQKLSPEEKKEQTKNRVLKMLQTQGVPVFPGLTQPKLRSRPTPPQHPQPHQQPLTASTPTSAPPPPSQFQAQPAMAVDPNANIGITKAYIKHLENHRKFDTLHSFQSCENCPICKQMISEIDVIVKQKNLRSSNNNNNNHRSSSGATNHHQSLITSGKAFEPLSILEEDEPDEFADDVNLNGNGNVAPQGYTYVGNGNYPSTSKNGSLESRHRYTNTNGYNHHHQNQHHREASVGSEPTEDVMTARARADWHADHPNQLTIKYGETLRVLKMGQDFTCCQNAHNEKGWVPNNHLYHMPSGSF